MNGYLVLADGTVFSGTALGAAGKTQGEVVFNTAMFGHQRVLTDPSNCGLIVSMTYPLVGNYGMNGEEKESERIQVAGLVIKEACDKPNHWLNQASLEDYLYRQGIVALAGVDTRFLTRHLRKIGAVPGIIISGEQSAEELSNLAAEAQRAGQSSENRQTCPGLAGEKTEAYFDALLSLKNRTSQQAPLVVVVDFGVKRSILQHLTQLGFEPLVVSATATAAEILALDPQGIVLSNGPGNPNLMLGAVDLVRDLVAGKKPILGICLGNLLLGMALGGKVEKMHFGHRGSNHPVQDTETGKVWITEQNHGFCLRENSLDPAVVQICFRNLNDQSVEGFAHRKSPICGSQFLPSFEVGSGDLQNPYLRFKQWVNEISVGSR